MHFLLNTLVGVSTLACYSLLLNSLMMVQPSEAKSCTHVGNCNSVTEKLGYVDCVGGQCVCAYDRGLDGAATTLDQCRCNAPKQAKLYDVDPDGIAYYCTDPVASVTCAHDAVFAAHMEFVMRAYYDNMIWPAPFYIMEEFHMNNNSFIAQLLSSSASARLDPYGEATNRKNIEVTHFGAVAQGNYRVVNVVYKKILTQDHRIDLRVDLLFNVFVNINDTTPVSIYNVSEVAMVTFNTSTGLIQSMEGTAINIGEASDTPKSIDILEYICALYFFNAGCNSTFDPIGSYPDFDSCVAAMDEYDYGTFSQLRANTTACRFFHTILAEEDPATHCVHVGYTGGGKCVPTPLEEYYTMDYKKRENVDAIAAMRKKVGELVLSNKLGAKSKLVVNVPTIDEIRQHLLLGQL